ncbi:Hypothetical predicted protein [Paramuricea clavata]|uniref:Uncharacterized protein n=1 Tax=Paramuricea clavata TaxID=317549 RepID=A0A6S7K7E3_PARCT|nr:Hypothetical predicted protein [Paramuricea clavata]
MVSKARLGKFYLLPKIHKRLENVPGRPVISNCENPEEPESDESEVQVSDSVEDTFPTENNMAVEESTDNHPNLTLLNGASILCTTEHDNNVTEKLKMVESQMNQKIERLAYEIQKLKDNKDATTLHAE